MVMLSQSHKNPLVKPCIANSGTDIPVVDLSCPHEAKKLIVNACQNYGFFKVINHGVPVWLVSELENEALAFFNMNQSEKDKYCSPNPLGYGSNKIGRNGDVGWIEYLLLNSNNFPTNRKILSTLAKQYVAEVKKLGCEILVKVITNGRFKSVRHRVITDRLKSRVSMVYFIGPPLMEKISPLSSLMEPGEESLYHEFTWFEYKSCTYKTKLADNRLDLFYKESHRTLFDNTLLRMIIILVFDLTSLYKSRTTLSAYGLTDLPM